MTSPVDNQNVKSVNHCRYLGIAPDTDLSDDTFRGKCDINTVQQTNWDLFSRCSNAVEMYFFVPSVRPFMHHNYGVSCIVLCNVFTPTHKALDFKQCAYSLLVDFASALLRFAQVAYDLQICTGRIRLHTMSLRVTGRFCVCITQICTGRVWVALLSRATVRPLFRVHIHVFQEKWSILRGHSKMSKRPPFCISYFV